MKSQPPSAEHWNKVQALSPRPHPLAGVAGRPQRAAPWQVPWAQMAAVTLPFPFTGPGIDPGVAEGQCPLPTSPGPQRGFGDHPSTHSSQSTPDANRIPSLHPPPRPRPAVHVTCHLSAGAAVQNDSGQGRRCSVTYDDPQPETTSASTGGEPHVQRHHTQWPFGGGAGPQCPPRCSKSDLSAGRTVPICVKRCRKAREEHVHSRNIPRGLRAACGAGPFTAYLLCSHCKQASL